MSRYSWRPQREYANLIPCEGALAFSFSYHPTMVNELKSRIPSTGRRWVPDEKHWLVDTQYATVCADLVMQYMGIALSLPMAMQKPKSETRVIKLEYLGQAKDRGGGEELAFGYADGDWTVAIPLRVLKSWFEIEDESRPNQAQTLYSVLGVKRSAEQDEIKKAYRRLARQWHPDVCNEPDATEQFQIIQNAYSVLNDERNRKRYDAGLAFSTTVKVSSLTKSTTGWRSPLRCGWLLAEGKGILGRFVIDKILAWEDITNQRGQTMVTSWRFGDKHFTTRWV